MAEQASRSDPPADPLSDALQRVLAAHTRAQAALARRLRVGRSDVDALEHLMVGPLAPSELADRLGLSAGAVSQMLTRLEERDHARRVPDPDDGRRARVDLTASGRATVLAHVLPMLRQLDGLADAVGRTHPEGASAIVAYLEGAAEALEGLAAPS